MDNFVSTVPAAMNILRESVSPKFIVSMVLTAAMLYFEVTRRTAGMPQRDRSDQGSSKSYFKLLRHYAPEAMGLVSCLSLSLYLRLYGTFVYESAADNQAFADIMRQWPILLGADTLLAIQAMLRLLVLISNVARAGFEPVLLSQEAAAISLGAAIGRAVLITQCKDYMLDGPLGGYLPVVCEQLSVPLLLILCRGINRKAVISATFTLCIAAWVGSRNQLALSGNAFSDGLFIFAHSAELFAGFAYLSRALLSDAAVAWPGRSSVALGFTHILMPVQQCLAAYYFVQAFEYVPALIGAGCPFEMLQIGGVAQVGAYAGAAVLHLAEYLESSNEDIGTVRDGGRHVEEVVHQSQGRPGAAANTMPATGVAAPQLVL